MHRRFSRRLLFAELRPPHDLQVGSMSNPPEWPGLAHFCEHMLFLGTSSYPTEGEFENYISVRPWRWATRNAHRIVLLAFTSTAHTYACK